MVRKTATIQNSVGIHVRPSGLIINAVKNYSGAITLFGNGMQIKLTSVMGLIALGLAGGSSVEIEVDGPDEEETCTMLVELFEKKYDFPRR